MNRKIQKFYTLKYKPEYMKNPSIYQNKQKIWFQKFWNLIQLREYQSLKLELTNSAILDRKLWEVFYRVNRLNFNRISCLRWINLVIMDLALMYNPIKTQLTLPLIIYYFINILEVNLNLSWIILFKKLSHNKFSL